MVDAAEPPGRGPRARGGAVGLWLSVVAVIGGILLALPVWATRNPALIVFVVFAIVAGVAGVVISRSARRSGGSSRARWAVVVGAAAIVVEIVVAIVLVTFALANRVTPVELRGQGPNPIDVTFSSQIETRTLQWPSNGRAEFNTEGSWAEITVTAPAGSATTTVSCQIVWNGETVVDESSDAGAVTCRYDAR